MKHVDEEILKRKKQMAMQEAQAYSDENIEKELEESIFDGKVHIYNQPVVFEEREVTELNLRIMMPEVFYLADDELRKMLYPLGNAPSHVFGSEEVIFNLALSQSGNKVPNEGIPKFLPMAKRIIDNIGPKSRMIGSGVIQKEEKNFAILEFVTAAMDTNVYNVMFYFSINDYLMIGTINFPTKYQKRLVKVAKEMIDSLVIIDQEEV